MSARDIDDMEDIIDPLLMHRRSGKFIAQTLAKSGYRRPRTITRPSQLEALPFGSAVQTSDESDTVVLRCEGENFRNQSGAEVPLETLWTYGAHPFTVIYEPKATQ